MSLSKDKPELAPKLTSILEKKSVVNNPQIQDKLIAFKTENFPLDIRKIRPGYKDYVLEIGSGWGEFTRQSAQQNPQNFYLALEKKKHRILKCIKLQNENAIKNINWMIIDIDWYFEDLFLPAQFDKIVINFPDPWPKKRHHKHRFIKPSLVALLAEIARPGAVLEYATDYWPYMESGLEILEKSGLWKNALEPLCVRHSIPGRPQSYFETLKKEEGENAYFAVMNKIL